MPRAVIADVDGTLVDTNYQHAVAWFLAFRQSGRAVPLWELHRNVGQGGDQFVAAVAGEAFDEEHGDQVRAAHDALYMVLIESVELLPDAEALLDDLRDRDVPVVLASSARGAELERYLGLLDADDRVHDWTTSDDVEASKPAPDLIEAALDKLGTRDAILIGDTPFDVEAARKAGLETVAVLTGGFSEQELREAGAIAVFRSLPELRAALDDLLG